MIDTIQTRPIVCNACNSDDAKPLFSAIDRLHGMKGTFQYTQCRKCGLVYMNPQIIPEQLSLFYPEDYAPHQPKSSSKKTKKQKKIKLNLPEIILKNLRPDSRVLDVGCGRGTFLYRMRESINCKVFGVDISKNAVECAKQQYNLDIVHGQIFDVPYSDNSFDLITGWACLEHFDNPALVLKKMSALCKVSGWLFIKIPNYRSFSAQCFKDRWYPLDAPRHLFLFSPKTITMLLKNSGFQDIHIYHDTSSKGWRGSLQYVFLKDNYRPEVKDKILQSSIIQALFSPIAYLSALLKHSDMMLVAAKKANIQS